MRKCRRHQNDAMIVTPTTAPLDIESIYLTYDHQFIRTRTAPPGNGMLLLEVAFDSPNSLTFSYAGIAEAYSLFLVDSGDIFGADYVNTGTSIVNNSNTPGFAKISLLSGESRYLVYWDDRTLAPDSIRQRRLPLRMGACHQCWR